MAPFRNVLFVVDVVLIPGLNGSLVRSEVVGTLLYWMDTYVNGYVCAIVKK